MDQVVSNVFKSKSNSGVGVRDLWVVKYSLLGKWRWWLRVSVILLPIVYPAFDFSLVEGILLYRFPGVRRWRVVLSKYQDSGGVGLNFPILA